MDKQRKRFGITGSSRYSTNKIVIVQGLLMRRETVKLPFVTTTFSVLSAKQANLHKGEITLIIFKRNVVACFVTEEIN